MIDIVYPGQIQLEPQLTELPSGEFLLPVCLDSRTLNNLLTSAYYGRLFAEKEIDPVSGEEFDTVAWMMPLLQAMAFANQPFLTGCWEGEYMGLVRYNNCQLEQFNLISQEWVAIAGASFLPLDLSCVLTGHNLFLRPESTQPGLFLQSSVPKPGLDYFKIFSAPNNDIFAVSNPGAIAINNRQGNNNTGNILQRFQLMHTNALNGFSGNLTWDAQTAANGPMRNVADVITGWLLATDASRVGRQRWFINGVSGQALMMEFQSATGGGKVGFFGQTPVVRPTVVGTTVPTALASMIAAATALGLVINTTDFLANAANLIRLENCQLDQFNPVTSAWVNVGNVVPTTITPACNIITLDDTDLTIVRVDGSTEAANAVLRLQTKLGTAADVLPMMLTFEQEQGDSSIDTLAQIDVRTMFEDTPRVAFNLFNGVAQNSILELQNGPAGRKIGFLGQPGQVRQPINRSSDLSEIVDQVVFALERFGLLFITPCMPVFGDWAIEWSGLQLATIATDCGISFSTGYQNEPNCPDLGDNTSTLQVDFGFGSAVNIVHAYMEVVGVHSVPPGDGIHWSITKNPGVGSTNLDNATVDGSAGSYEFAWNGATDIESLGWTITSPDTASSWLIKKVRLEGFGTRPADSGGDECGEPV